MSMDTQQTTEQQGEWVPLLGGDWDITTDLQDVQLVFVPSTTSDDFDEDLKRAKRDPANVLNVSAYPKVVQALEEAEKNLDKLEPLIINAGFTAYPLLKQIRAALSAVHPQGDKG